MPCPELRLGTGRAALGMTAAGVEASTSRARLLQRGLKSCPGGAALAAARPQAAGRAGRGCGRSAARLSAFLRPSRRQQHASHFPTAGARPAPPAHARTRPLPFLAACSGSRRLPPAHRGLRSSRPLPGLRAPHVAVGPSSGAGAAPGAPWIIRNRGHVLEGPLSPASVPRAGRDELHRSPSPAPVGTRPQGQAGPEHPQQTLGGLRAAARGQDEAPPAPDPLLTCPSRVLPFGAHGVGSGARSPGLSPAALALQNAETPSPITNTLGGGVNVTCAPHTPQSGVTLTPRHHLVPINTCRLHGASTERRQEPREGRAGGSPPGHSGPIHHSPSTRQRRMCAAPRGTGQELPHPHRGHGRDQAGRAPASGLPWGTARCWCGHTDTGTAALGASKHGELQERCSPGVLRVLQLCSHLPGGVPMH